MSGWHRGSFPRGGHKLQSCRACNAVRCVDADNPAANSCHLFAVGSTQVEEAEDFISGKASTLERLGSWTRF